jgi:outer membrane protein assembly factor BamA
MKVTYRYFVLFFFVVTRIYLFPQERNYKDQRLTDKYLFELGLAGGLSKSVVFLTRNINEFNDAYGLYLQLSVNRPKKLIRNEISFTNYRKIQIEPTWKDVKSWTIEHNVNFMARFVKTDAYLFPTAGWCFSRYEGFFTGVSDVQGLRAKFRPNTNVRQYWAGLNFGVGAEKIFYPFSIGMYYKMRVSNGDLIDKLSIVDVCYHFFAKYYFKRIFSKKYLGPRGRYILKTNES